VFAQTSDPLTLSMPHDGRTILAVARQHVLEGGAKQRTETRVDNRIGARGDPAQPDEHLPNIEY